MTDSDDDVLEYIRARMVGGRTTSMGDIRTAFRSVNIVAAVKRLERRGLVKTRGHRGRRIELAADSPTLKAGAG